MEKSAWLKSPYATSEVKDPDRAIEALLGKYGVINIQTTSCNGPNGRSAYQIRFQLKDRVYRIGMEVLDVRGVETRRLVRQVKRAVYHFLKPALEFATIFAPLDQVLFGFVETADGNTTYDVGKQFLHNLLPGRFYPPALPAHQE